MLLAPQSCAVLLVDLQRAFCEPEGSMAQQGRDIAAMRAALAASRRLADGARARGLPVAWTRMIFRRDYADGGRLVADLRPNLKAAGALRQGTADAALAAQCGFHDGDPVFDKNRFSAALGTGLLPWLEQRGIQRIVVGGVTTSMCVDTTVRDLAQRDFAVFVAREACGDFDEPRHRAALEALSFGFARVIALDDALTALAGDGRDF